MYEAQPPRCWHNALSALAAGACWPVENSSGRLAEVALALGQRLLDLLPGGERPDWARQMAARWRLGPFGGEFAPLGELDAVALDDLVRIDDQKRRLAANTEQFVRGFPANNALLWGARGTGKSSLVHALLNHYASAGLRLVEVDKRALGDISAIAARLRSAPYRFLLVCDDLSFEAGDASYKALKSALEGSAVRQAGNMVIYATSNRRHLLPEAAADNAAASHQQGELRESEAVEEKISLSDRFGLALSFYPFRQEDYLAAARHWVARLAAAHDVAVEWDAELRRAALRWALARGVRSGRTALHFARHHVGGRLLAASRGEP